jgi:hypothetical protein
VVAGPNVSPVNLSIPLDAGTAAGQMRAHVAVEDHLRKAKQAATRKARTAPPAIAAGTVDPGSRTAAPVGGDLYEIPPFLRRTRGTSKQSRSSAVPLPAAQRRRSTLLHRANLEQPVA